MTKPAALVDLASVLLPGDETLADEVRDATKTPRKYFDAHVEQLRKRGVTAPHKWLPWLALVEGLLARKKAAEVPVSCIHEVIALKLKILSGKAVSVTGQPIEALQAAGDQLGAEGSVLARLPLADSSYIFMILPAADHERARRISRTAGFGELTAFGRGSERRVEDAKLLELCTRLVPGDPSFLTEVTTALEKPADYLRTFAARIARRNTFGDPLSKLRWIAVLDGLVARGRVIETKHSLAAEDLLALVDRLLDGRVAPDPARWAWTAKGPEDPTELLFAVADTVAELGWALAMLSVPYDTFTPLVLRAEEADELIALGVEARMRLSLVGGARRKPRKKKATKTSKPRKRS